LIEDRSYDWSQSTSLLKRADWQYAIRFRDGASQTLLVFDLTSGQVLEPELDRRADIRPIAAGLQTFFDEQLPIDPQLRRPDSDDT
jgi:hypothetical protein